MPLQGAAIHMKLGFKNRRGVDAVVEEGRKRTQNGSSDPRGPRLDGLLTLGLYFLHLRGQTAHVVLEPAGHIHVVTAHTLQGSILSPMITTLSLIIEKSSDPIIIK